MVEFESSHFRVSSQEIEELRKKYCDSCPLCCGGRLIGKGEDAIEKCKCVYKFNVEYSLTASNIPEIFRSLSKDDIDTDFGQQNKDNLIRVVSYSKQFQRALDTGFGMFIQGDHGAGKSFISTLILKSALEKGYSCYFIMLADLVQAAFSALRESDVQRDLERLITEIDFLVVDEIDKAFPDKNDLVQNLLETLFKKRYNSGKPLIVVSNIKKSSIGSSLGKSIAAMFNERLTEITFVGNYRPQILNKLEGEFFGSNVAPK